MAYSVTGVRHLLDPGLGQEQRGPGVDLADGLDRVGGDRRMTAVMTISPTSSIQGAADSVTRVVSVVATSAASAPARR